MTEDPAATLTEMGRRARAASLVLANAPTSVKNGALRRIAEGMESGQAALLEANRRDLEESARDLAPPQIDRLTLNGARLAQLAASLREVAALPDPVGEVLEEWTRPNGLNIRKIRVPIGVIGIVFEARPNVTVDCAALCLKSGNASILRGGREIFHTNQALARVIGQALAESSLPADAVQLLPSQDRALLQAMLKLNAYIHCLIPRGGEGLIRFVTENSTIPVIKHYTGVCFVYVDRSADPELAERIVLNAKTQRPGVCNAAEQLLIHAEAAPALLPRLASALSAKKVQLRCDPASAALLARAGIAHQPAEPADFSTEFLDLIIAIRVVSSLEEAVAVINRDGSAHSDAIVTRDEPAARRFLAAVDSAAVFWNASTRFHDGFEFGFGAEIGISTDRLHARGPMGLRELCTHKFLVTGTGQVRD